MIDVFRKGKFELFAVTKTKLERNEEVSLSAVNGILAGVQETESV